MANLEKKTLVKAAKELNGVLGLEPEIDVKLKQEKLEDAILSAAELLEPEDDISPSTMDVINTLKGEAAPEPETEGEVVGDDEEAPDSEENEEPDEELEEPKKEPVKKKPPFKKSATHGEEEKVTRVAAAGMAIREGNGKDMDELVKMADDIFVENGGNSNLKESRWAMRNAINALKGFGVIQVEGNGVKW